MPGSRPNFPSDPNPRRLGLGGGTGGNDKLLRVQLTIAVALGFTILAVLLYLWRRPNGTENAAHDAAGASASAIAPAPVIVRTTVEAPKKPPERVKLGPVQRVKCGASPKLTGGADSLCDSLPFFEQALGKAIEETVDCAPKAPDPGTINYVIAVDFRTHDVRVYPGKSGSWRGKQAKKACECVRRAMTAPTWDTLSHQYRWYAMAILATYPGQKGMDGLPNFE